MYHTVDSSCRRSKLFVLLIAVCQQQPGKSNVARFVTFDERLLVKHNQRRRQYYLYPLTVYVNVYIAVLYNGVNGWK